MAECNINTPVKDTSEIAVVSHAIALAYDRTRNSLVGASCRAAGVTTVRQCTHRNGNGLPIPRKMAC